MDTTGTDSAQFSGREIENAAQLTAVLESGQPLGGLRLQSLDLTPYASLLSARTDVAGLVVLGGIVPAQLAGHLARHGAHLHPSNPGVPMNPYRAELYTPAELYAGIEAGYETTPDATIYAWSRDLRWADDVLSSMLRAIHDDAITDDYLELIQGQPVVGIMGGHALEREDPAYRETALLAQGLAARGAMVLTGGGPGAMEAANLGAHSPDPVGVDRAVAALRGSPSWRTDVAGWVRSALAARELLAPITAAPRSIGIPTWFYGHEPPNATADLHAKMFSNAVREDLLLASAGLGVVVMPGAAGTVQEIFQACTRMYYATDEQPIPPLVLVGRDHWAKALPVWPLLSSLADGRRMAGQIHLVDSASEALAVLTRLAR